MRTLKLTHEQIELVIEALGIAENVCNKTFKDISESLVRYRGGNNKKDIDVALHYHNKASSFADLNIDIRNSEFDV